MNRRLFDNRSQKGTKGFTLIELLVVIGIIGILASVVFTAIAPARMKARDARRLAEMTHIKNALELYYATNREFPQLRAYTDATNCGVNWCALETALAPYLNPFPRDPLGPDTTYVYYYDSNSGDNFQSYGLMMRPESASTLAGSDGGYYALFYETGTQPKYCVGKYTGLAARWWPTTPSSATVCSGGN